MNKSPGGYLKCIATREGVEMAEDTSRHLPATAEQQKQIKALIKKHPQSKESHEYEYYIANPTRGNADAFLWNICEEYQDGPKRDVYLNAGTQKLVASIVAELARDSRIQKLYSLWYEQKEDVIRTYTNKMPERIPLEQEKEFRAIRNAVVQAALQLQLPQEELPLSDPVPPRVDFVDDGSDVYPKAVESLRGARFRSQTIPPRSSNPRQCGCRLRSRQAVSENRYSESHLYVRTGRGAR